MKFPTLSLILMTAACGGGGEKKNVNLVDGPPANPGVANSKNDMYLITYDQEAGMLLEATGHEDSPDNQAAPLAIPSGAVGKRISGEMSVGGLHTDEYFERDTFVITTGADVNQLSIRLAWDGAVSDHDFVLMKEVVGAEEPDVIATGTLISNDANEFSTFVVEPNTKYWLWTGVYQVQAGEGAGAPVLPAKYDISIFGEAFAGTSAACTTASDFTEANDVTNDTLSTGAPATNAPEASGQTLTTAAHTFCGALNTGHFVPNAQDPASGIVDVDSFSLTVGGQGTSVIATLVGATPADKTALAALGQVQYLILDKDGAYFDRGFFQYNSHGVLTTRLPPTVDAQGMDTGPKSIAIIAFNNAAIPANINYRIRIAAEDPTARAPRLMGASDTTEANDN